jgi:cell division protein FtsZ
MRRIGQHYNLTMKEFDEVGRSVADLASDDATVVIGTVIDPEMGDELRVTVVATGLGDSARRHEPEEQPIQIVRNGTTGMGESISYEDAIEIGNKETEVPAATEQTGDMFRRQEDIEYLDIPSFLRKQAD